MHGRGHKEDPEECLKPFGDFQTAMVELGTKDYRALKGQYTRRTRTQEQYDGFLDNGENDMLSQMKPCRCRDIHVQITVMDPVKTPKKGYFVV